MRIMHVYPADNGHGGIESMLLTLHRFSNSRLESLFTLHFENRLAEALRAAGASVFQITNGVRLRKPLSVLDTRRHFAALLFDERIDAVLFHNASAWLWLCLAAAVKRAGVPLGIWFHDPFDQRYWLDRLAKLTRPDFLLFNSEVTQEKLTPRYPELHSFVIHPPVERPPDAPCQRLATRAELGAPANAVAIVHVSRMVSGKGHALLFEALGRLRDLPGWVCWVVGAPQQPPEQRYFESLRRMALELGIAGRVKFPGYWPDLPRLYAAADIYCQPNITIEPFGLTFIEALYAGLPCVATSSSGGPELILSGNCGVIVPQNNSDALAAVLAELIRNHELRERLGANGPTRARQLCDPETQMAKLHATMLEACASRR